MDDKEKAREYARRYREQNREQLREKARAYHARKQAEKPPRRRLTVEERFWPKVRVGAADECWEWQAGKSYGYGSFRYQGRSVNAQRVAWELQHGPIPEGMDVLHHCDNPPCVNTAHLYLGTDVENARDRTERDRFVSNVHHAVAKRKPGWNKKQRDDDRRGGKPKLTQEQQAEVRRIYATTGMSMRAIAKEYDVTHHTISRIVRQRIFNSVAW